MSGTHPNTCKHTHIRQQAGARTWVAGRVSSLTKVKSEVRIFMRAPSISPKYTKPAPVSIIAVVKMAAFSGVYEKFWYRFNVPSIAHVSAMGASKGINGRRKRSACARHREEGNRQYHVDSKMLPNCRP